MRIIRHHCTWIFILRCCRDDVGHVDPALVGLDGTSCVLEESDWVFREESVVGLVEGAEILSLDVNGLFLDLCDGELVSGECEVAELIPIIGAISRCLVE